MYFRRWDGKGEQLLRILFLPFISPVFFSVPGYSFIVFYFLFLLISRRSIGFFMRPVDDAPGNGQRFVEVVRKLCV